MTSSTSTSPSATTWKPSAVVLAVTSGTEQRLGPGLGRHTPLRPHSIANSAPTATAHAVAVRLFDALHIQDTTPERISTP